MYVLYLNVSQDNFQIWHLSHQPMTLIPSTHNVCIGDELISLLSNLLEFSRQLNNLCLSYFQPEVGS